MRSSLIILAMVLATLHLVRGALTPRRRVSLIPGRRRGDSAALGVSEFSLAEGVAVEGGPAEMGRRRAGRGNSAPGDADSSRFTDWRYYGFSIHDREADAAVAEPLTVARAPAIGSVVSTLPDDCINAMVNGGVYWQCGSVWYQPQYTGSDVTYVVVRAP